MAVDLYAVGVQRLNISLDSLNPGTFRKISGCGDLSQVLAGIEAAKECGFPIKLNMVVMRGINDHELHDFARLATTSATTVRFIEYMPAIREHNWQRLVVSGAEILSRLSRQFTLIPAEQAEMAGPARNFHIPGAPGALGVITPVSRHFCSECNRIRVTASGLAKGCLFSESQSDLKPSLRSGSGLLLTRALDAIVQSKPVCHQMSTQECHHQAFSMSSVGG
jgi:cyclic pyranopterin phosphate synthase